VRKTASQCVQQITQGLADLAAIMDGKFTATRQELLLAKYGMTCTVSAAMKELCKGRHAVNVMLDDGRLTRLSKGVDVVSLAEYMEDAKNHDFRARVARQQRKPARTAIRSRASTKQQPQYITAFEKPQEGEPIANASGC